MIFEMQQLISEWKDDYLVIISNHYGIKFPSNLLQLEPCNVMFQVISDRMAHWNHL